VVFAALEDRVSEHLLHDVFSEEDDFLGEEAELGEREGYNEGEPHTTSTHQEPAIQEQSSLLSSLLPPPPPLDTAISGPSVPPSLPPSLPPYSAGIGDEVRML